MGMSLTFTLPYMSSLPPHCHAPASLPSELLLRGLLLPDLHLGWLLLPDMCFGETPLFNALLSRPFLLRHSRTTLSSSHTFLPLFLRMISLKQNAMHTPPSVLLPERSLMHHTALPRSLMLSRLYFPPSVADAYLSSACV